MSYVGRFAPSPTGRLHLGSLIAATASCLEARSRNGRWLLRIEDLDTPRRVPGSADDIQQTLRTLGFEWDGPVTFQSRRTAAYEAALAHLQATGLVYACGCSRRQLEDSGSQGVYPGTCRNGTRAADATALRFRVDDAAVLDIEDRLQGARRFVLRDCGDPVIRRRDGLFAYQLAVVIDDAAAGVTDVVRGVDLLDSTGWQLALQAALGFTTPSYMHLPLVVGSDGSKLSKSSEADAIDGEDSGRWLCRALRLLRQSPPPGLEQEPKERIWSWAVANWNAAALRGAAAITEVGPAGRSVLS